MRIAFKTPSDAGVDGSGSAGTTRQQGLVRDAIEEATFPWDRSQLKVDFTFVVEGTFESDHFDGATVFGDTAFITAQTGDISGDRAVIRIWDKLDDHDYLKVHGLAIFASDAFFKETVLHELGHAWQQAELDDEAQHVFQTCWAPSSGIVVPWDTGGHDGQAREALAETFKDVFFPGRAFDNRTQHKMMHSSFPDYLRELARITTADDFFDGAANVVGFPRGDWTFSTTPLVQSVSRPRDDGTFGLVDEDHTGPLIWVDQVDEGPVNLIRTFDWSSEIGRIDHAGGLTLQVDLDLSWPAPDHGLLPYQAVRDMGIAGPQQGVRPDDAVGDYWTDVDDDGFATDWRKQGEVLDQSWASAEWRERNNNILVGFGGTPDFAVDRVVGYDLAFLAGGIEARSFVPIDTYRLGSDPSFHALIDIPTRAEFIELARTVGSPRYDADENSGVAAALVWLFRFSGGGTGFNPEHLAIPPFVLPMAPGSYEAWKTRTWSAIGGSPAEGPIVADWPYVERGLFAGFPSTRTLAHRTKVAVVLPEARQLSPGDTDAQARRGSSSPQNAGSALRQH